MVDLTEILDQGSPGQAVEAWYEANQKPRLYLGLSEIGHECPRYLYYRHHGYEPTEIDGRVIRLFQAGNNIEDQAIKDLRSAGYMITNNQKEVTFDYHDITLRGHIDGIITGLLESSKPHLWECKSANDKSFKKLQKAGYEEWNPKYKAQIHVYALGLGLDNILAYVENKNDSSIYTERIKLDKEYAVNLLQDVFEAISKPEPPERKCPSQSWYAAKWCDFAGVCWQ
jgi:hypothetical protein